MLARLSTALSGTDTADADIPAPRAVNPRLREIEDRVAKLKDRLAELKREHVRSIELMREAATDRIRREAGEILANRPTEAHRSPPDVHKDILAVEHAIEQLRVEANDATMEASATIRERVAPRHAALVRNVADAMLTLYRAHADYIEFADNLNSRGIAWSMLYPMHVSWLGEPTDRQSNVAMWLKEAVRNKFIPADTIPERLR